MQTYIASPRPLLTITYFASPNASCEQIIKCQLRIQDPYISLHLQTFYEVKNWGKKKKA